MEKLTPKKTNVRRTAEGIFMAANIALAAEQGIAHDKHIKKPVTEQTDTRDPMHEAAAFNHMEKKLRDKKDYDPNKGAGGREQVG